MSAEKRWARADEITNAATWVASIWRATGSLFLDRRVVPCHLILVFWLCTSRMFHAVSSISSRILHRWWSLSAPSGRIVNVEWRLAVSYHTATEESAQLPTPTLPTQCTIRNPRSF